MRELARHAICSITPLGMNIGPIGYAIAGGALLGASAALLFAANGRIAGISGIVGGLLVPQRGEIEWRALFVGGLLVGGIIAFLVAPGAFAASADPDLVRLAIAGLLVGAGARLGSGCTSGHGVCGISRASPRSIVATVTFMTTGALAVLAVRLLGGTP